MKYQVELMDNPDKVLYKSITTCPYYKIGIAKVGSKFCTKDCPNFISINDFYRDVQCKGVEIK